MSSEAVTAKPAVPEPPTVQRAYKDEIIVNLGPLEAGCTRVVEYALTPAILYYTWVKIADEEVTDTSARITGLTPEKSIVTRVTVRNAAGSSTSATSVVFTTLSVSADQEVRLQEAREAAATARADYARVFDEVTTLRVRIAELEVSASGSDSAKSARIAQLESEITKLRAELAEAVTRAEAQKREIKTLVEKQAEVSQLHADVDKFRREAKALRDTQDASIKRIAEANETKSVLEQKLGVATRELAAAQALATEKDSLATELQERVTALQGQCDGLRAQLDATTAECEHLSKELAVCTATVSAMQTQMTQTEASVEAAKSCQLNEAMVMTEAHAREVEALKKRLQEVSEELQASKQHAAEVREAEEKEHALRLQAAVAGHADAVKLLTDEVATLRRSNEQLSTDLEAARAGIRMVQDSTKVSSDQLAAKVAGLEESLALSRRESDRLRAEAQAALEQVAHAEASHRVALEQVQASTQVALATSDSLRTKLGEEERKCQQAIADRRAAQDAVTRSDAEVVALRGEVERLRAGGSSEVQRLRDELASAAALNAQTMSNLITDVSRLEAANMKLMSQIAAMRQQATEDQAMLAKTQGELWELKSTLGEGGLTSSMDLAKIRSDFNTCYLKDAFTSAGLRDGRLEGAFAAFWALKDMGFESEAARHAVAAHPDDTNAQATAAMSYTPPKKSSGWFG